MKTSSSLVPIALAVLTLHLAPVAAAGPSPDIWTWRNPLPTGNQLNSITYGKGLFVAVGANNTIVTSPDARNWSQQVAPTNCSLSGIAYSPGQTLFVAVGADAATGTKNVILTSVNGIAWFPAAGIGNGGFLAVATDGAKNIVAVGNSGVVWYSTDGGSTWQAGTTPPGAQNWNAVTYGNGMFVAVGNGGQVFTSTTGSSWTQQFAGGTTSVLNGITYQAGKGFVAVGNGAFLFSAAGTSWSISTASYFGNAVVYANGQFVVGNTATYYPGVLTSPDGQTWTGFTVYDLFGAIAYDGSSTFAGVGSGSTIAYATSPTAWTAINTSVDSGSLSVVVYGTTYGGTNSTGFLVPGTNLFVAGGAGISQSPAILTSTNGFNWHLDTDPSIDNEVQFYDSFVNGLAYGTNSLGKPIFVATVNTTPGYLYAWPSVIVTSSDAIVWKTNFISYNLLNGITCGVNAAGQPVFVAVGDPGWILWSTNLGAWNVSESAFLETSASLYAVTCGTPGGSPLFVAVGAGGTVLTSPEGTNWTLQTSGTSGAFNGVTFGNNLFVAVGAGGIIYTSSNGTTWTPQTSGTTANLNGVSFANNVFVAVTGNNVSGAGILTSPDGINWTPAFIVAPNSLNAVAFGNTFGNNQFIAVGNEGAILGSVLSAILPGQFSPTTGFTLTVSGPPGEYAVYVSYDLINWTAQLPYILLTSQTPSVIWTDPNATIHSGGYYHVGPAP